MLNAYLYAGLRTPFGRQAGALAPVRPDDLAAHVIRELLARHQVPGDAVEDVILGNTNQAGEDSRNVARHAALLAGLPVTVPGQTVNRLCASGLAAVIDAARAVTCGEGELFVAGGVESMSRAPFVMAKAETAYSRELSVFDSTIGARFPNPKIIEAFGNDSMPQTGDNVAREYDISREQADHFAAASQARYEAVRRASLPTRSFPSACLRGARRRRILSNRTSIRARNPTRRHWLDSSRCSRVAWSLPVTHRGSTMAPLRC
jgi:acetyl-CoA acetyltransferase